MSGILQGMMAVIQISCDEVKSCPSKTPDVGAVFTNIIHATIGLVGGLAVVFIIVSGLQIALSAGDPKRYQQGRRGLLYSVIGVILSIAAYGIVTYITKIFV